MKNSIVTELDYFIAWIVFFLIATIGGAILGFIGGAVIGGLLGVLGAKAGLIRAAAGAVGFILSLPLSYFAFRFSVSKFIVSKAETAPAAPSPVAQSYAPATLA